MDDRLQAARDAMMELRRRVNTVYENTMLGLDGYAQRRMYAEALRAQGGLDSFAYVRGMIDECLADKTFFRMAGIDIDAPKQTPPPAAPNGLPVWRKMTEKPRGIHNVLVWTGGVYIVLWHMPSAESWRDTDGQPVDGLSSKCRWLDLNGFTPEVGE